MACGVRILSWIRQCLQLLLLKLVLPRLIMKLEAMAAFATAICCIFLIKTMVLYHHVFC